MELFAELVEDGKVELRAPQANVPPVLPIDEGIQPPDVDMQLTIEQMPC